MLLGNPTLPGWQRWMVAPSHASRRPDVTRTSHESARRNKTPPATARLAKIVPQLPPSLVASASPTLDPRSRRDREGFCGRGGCIPSACASTKLWQRTQAVTCLADDPTASTASSTPKKPSPIKIHMKLFARKSQKRRRHMQRRQNQ